MSRTSRRRRNNRNKQQKREKAINKTNDGDNKLSPAASFAADRNRSVSPTAGSVLRGGAPAGKSGGSITHYSAGGWSAPVTKELQQRPNPQDVLRFSPLAWSKYMWFRDRGDSEIGAFGISLKEEPLYVIDLITVLQQCTSVHVEFDDEAVSEFLTSMTTAGYHPSEVMRIWLHTHPGTSASPSGTDMNTFRDVFGGTDWSMMVILAKGGECKAKIRFNAGPGGEMDLNTIVDLRPPFVGVSDEINQEWEEEYVRNVRTRGYTARTPTGSSSSFSGRGSMGGHRSSYGGCHGMEYGEEGWWKDDPNGDSNGFASGGSAQGSSGSSSQTNSDTSDKMGRMRLNEQTALPPYGGVHRLEARETEAKWRLVNDAVEQIWQVDENDDETQSVITDLGWYTFGAKAKLNAAEGDDIDSIRDISDEPPIACGEISWRISTAGELMPMKITRILSGGAIVDLRDDEDQAKAELFQAPKTTTTDNTAGFAAPASSTESEPESVVEITPAAALRDPVCAKCEAPLDTTGRYYLQIKGTKRAHIVCVSDPSNWTMIGSDRTSPSTRETDVLTKEEVYPAAALAAATPTRTASGGSTKGINEPGFGPAGGDADGADNGAVVGADAGADAGPVGPSGP